MALRFRNLRLTPALTPSAILLVLGVGLLSHFLTLGAHPPGPAGLGARPPAIQGEQEEPYPSRDTSITREMERKQRKQLLKSRFEEMKANADELAALAKSLQEDVDKSNENVLSLKIMEKAEKIERLAKKIKNAAKGS